MPDSLSRRDFLKASAVVAGAVAATPGVASAAARAPRAWRAAPKPDSLNMLYATVEADADAIKLVLPGFKSEFGFGINLDTIPYNALQQKVFAELAAKSSHYDIMIVDTPWMPALTQKIEPLSSYIQNKSLTSRDLALSDFIDKVFYDTAVYKAGTSHLHFPNPKAKIDIPAIKAQGFDVFGLPIQANALTMSYRKDLFESAKEKAAFKQQTGKELRVPQTWDEFVTVAKFFTRPGERLYGTTLMAGSGDWATDDFKTLLAAFGGDGHLVTDSFKRSFAGPQGIAALQFYQDLINKHKVTPPGTTAASWDTVTSTFASGLTAISMNYHQETLNKNVQGSIGYALVPRKVAYGPHFGTWMLSLNKFGKNKEWAYKALVWVTAAHQQQRMLSTQLHPTRKSVYAKANKDAAISAKFGNFYDVLGKSLAVGAGRPRLTNYGDIDQRIWVAVNNAARGQSVEAQLKTADDQVAKLLRQAGYPA
jgi:multiple sugar transport system substrate-binding protein